MQSVESLDAMFHRFLWGGSDLSPLLLGREAGAVALCDQSTAWIRFLIAPFGEAAIFNPIFHPSCWGGRIIDEVRQQRQTGAVAALALMTAPCPVDVDDSAESSASSVQGSSDSEAQRVQRIKVAAAERAAKWRPPVEVYGSSGEDLSIHPD